MPPFLRFLLLHALIGFGLAALFVAVIFWADPFGFATVLRQSAGHPWPAILLWFFCGLTFSSIQMGANIMMQDEGGDH
ncbi:hypothetical protein [uncultured Ferrovibrio sp.]|jgi:hypothetical protein|uniref:hypothetical protein n=1 Tax=uncultured Ferrovibrio sp. TaxID=1576913 RepID=UPI0026229D12|nr:hypothetical protein [uncultured Ferrovibrio sp.]